MLLDYVIIKLSERKSTKGALTYYVITEGGGRGGWESLKGLCMIMEGDREGGWPCYDISK